MQRSVADATPRHQTLGRTDQPDLVFTITGIRNFVKSYEKLRHLI